MHSTLDFTEELLAESEERLCLDGSQLEFVGEELQENQKK